MYASELHPFDLEFAFGGQSYGYKDSIIRRLQARHVCYVLHMKMGNNVDMRKSDSLCSTSRGYRRVDIS